MCESSKIEDTAENTEQNNSRKSMNMIVKQYLRNFKQFAPTFKIFSVRFQVDWAGPKIYNPDTYIHNRAFSFWTGANV